MNNRNVFIIRKSWIDEYSELARCSDFDLALSICKSGYNIYDEYGNLVYSSLNKNKYQYGQTWIALKSKIEKVITDFDKRRFPFFIARKSELCENINILNDVLKLMNKIEIEESKNE